MTLWTAWWDAIWLLRPAFSRLRSFMWFTTAVAGLTVRTELLGVTSIHPEKNLCAYVWSETANWLRRIVPEDSDRYVMLVVVNLVNCIAYVPMPNLGKPVRRREKSA
ncbi:hypothetical protein BZM27_24485 [Paraburkholderia steynii]|uniref:Uncharacterized protein n=1 Tax=Paraburkholderia steynii TaxID=1245441 RepID=A0A4R0X8W5_9BURK|nr:hypothetical protein BZM27_24485 [Paraburkholderia steynii]